MKVSEHIRQARGHIANGWGKGFFDDGESCCVIGALERVALENIHDGAMDTYGPAKNKVFVKMKEVLNKAYLSSIPALNDDHDTTREDVLVAMEKAQLEAEETEDFAEIDGE